MGATDDPPSTETSFSAATASGIASTQHNLTFIPVTWSTAAAPDTSKIPATVSRLDAYYDQVSNGRIRATTRSVLPLQHLKFTPTAKDDACGAYKIDAAVASLYQALPKTRYEHVVILVPAISGCSYTGYGSVGPDVDSREHIWLFGPGSFANSVVAHEFGHNLGLTHSDELSASCALTTPKTAAPFSPCHREYGDPWDVMGNSTYAPVNDTATGFMSSANLDRLGLLAANEKQVVSSVSTTVTIKPVAGRSGKRLVTIPWGTRTFTLEYRAATGLDSWINSANGYVFLSTGKPIPAAGSGVVVRFRDRVSSAKDAAIFFQRPTGQAALPVGQDIPVSGDGGLKIKVNSMSAAAANVTITRRADSTAPSIGTQGLATGYKEYANGTDVIKSSTLSVAWGVDDADSAVRSVALQVDGKNRATYAAPAPYAPLRAGGLKYGRHTWRLVVTDIWGNTKTSEASVILLDSGAKPKITVKPYTYLTVGTVSTKSAPARVTWAAKDECGITQSQIASNRGLRKLAASPPKSIGLRLGVGKSTYFQAQAMDCWGTFTPVVTSKSTRATLDKQSKRKGYHGTWTATKAKKALGGTEQVTKKKKAYVTYKVKARSIGWVATKGKDRGKAAVYVDGKKVAVVNLSAKKTTYAQQVFTKTWSKAGTHTIKIVNLTSKKVGVDAFTRLS
ncbi:hypothetical protein D1825_13705 [Cellulomonas rhizosphaerae]|uniref:Peptidase M11 gametolysin domain-containing protein n=2 Tax=Cellulomonas rhizosphaerae TaxID=2293719 RepID=A0A413RJ75_9CELL|nr:hypothetical protein D1825_13705 [Cellulomonas rhizosphaerae]